MPAFATLLHQEEAYRRGKEIVEALKETLPRQQFVVKIQASIGAKVIASERLQGFRKDVLAKMSGGDYTRKSKLLQKQKAGKERTSLAQGVGQVDIPQEAFIKVLRRGTGRASSVATSGPGILGPDPWTPFRNIRPERVVALAGSSWFHLPPSAPAAILAFYYALSKRRQLAWKVLVGFVGLATVLSLFCRTCIELFRFRCAPAARLAFCVCGIMGTCRPTGLPTSAMSWVLCLVFA